METFAVDKDLEKRDNIEISDILYKLIPFWPLFIILLVIAAVTAAAYIRYKVPVYEISANILLKDEQKGLDESNIMESLNMFGSKKIVDNEIEVLRSKSLMKQVINNLQLYAPVYEKGRVKDAFAYTSSPLKIEVKHPDLISYLGKAYFRYDSLRNKVSIGKNQLAVNQWFVCEHDTVRFIYNRSYSPPSEKRQLFFSLVNVKQETEDLIEDLDIFPVTKQATVINMKFKDEIPQRGEDILNELIQVYNRAAIQDKNILASNTLLFVEDRLKRVTDELGQVEGSIENYKSSKGIVDLSEQGKLFLSSVQENDQKIAEMNMQLAVLGQVEKYVLSKESNAGIVPSTLGVNDPVLTQLLQSLYELQLQYERLRKTTAENNPMLVSIQDQIERVKPGIIENIRNQKNALLAGRNNLHNNSNRYSSLLQSIPHNERELLEISRQQVIKNNIYTFLLQKREETALSFAATVADSRIVDAAEASFLPVSPKKSVVYLIALLAALIAGVAIVYIKELLNRSILFRDEIKKYVSWPIIGEISYSDSLDNIVIGEGKRSIIAEQFRQLRTSLDYLSINGSVKKILLTSSISGEGKSFIAVNMAMSLALAGKKVVLIELDLRKPKLSMALDIKTGSKGITHYFIGKASFSEIIHHTEIHENLDFIASGPIPPNPSELILNGKLAELLGFLEKAYDYVLIDSAPVAPVTDAHILSKFCDATLYIIRHGYTPKVHVKSMEENNKMRGLKNVAIIFNGLKGRGFGRYGYGYGYGYDYGHEYSLQES